MQVTHNNLGPPKLKPSFSGEVPAKGEPQDLFEFRSMVGKSWVPPQDDFQAMLANQKAEPLEKKSLSGIDEKSRDLRTRPSNLKPKNGNPTETSTSRSMERARESSHEASEESGATSRGLKVKDAKNKEAPRRNSAVQKFMDSIESELGISAERFSAALANLPKDVKALPLEQSAPFVVNELGISGAMQGAATESYVNLLQQSGLTGSTDQIGKFAAGDGLEFFPRLSSLDSRAALDPKMNALSLNNRQNLNATIDDLNRRFFDVGQAAQSPAGLADSMNGDMSNINALASSLDINSVRKDESPLYRMELSGNQQGVEAAQNLFDLERMGIPSDEINEMMYQSTAGAESLSANAEGAKASQAVGPTAKAWSVEELPFLIQSSQMEQVGPTSGLNFNVAGGFTEPNRFDSGNGGKGVGASTFEATQSLTTTGDGMLAESAAGKLTKQEGREATGEEASSGQDFTNQFFGAGQMQRGSIANQTGANRSAAAFSEMSAADKMANVSKISSAAEALSSRGGGEMKIVLTPEGLGTVQLKVKMQGGKLQVEMKAESQESQKLLESSLSDLKQQLSAQRLSIDSVKVDVGGDFTRQESQQSFSQQQFDMGRDQARQFMHQFRDGNLSQRQSFFDAPGFKTYRSQREEPLAPIASEVRPRGTLASNKGREINLVA